MTASSCGSYRVVLLTADRQSDADALATEIETQAKRSGGTRAALEITRDPTVLDAVPEPDDPTTVLVVVGGSAATGQDPVIGQAVARCQETLRACLPVFDRSGTFQEQMPTQVHELNGVLWDVGSAPASVAAHTLRLLGLAEGERRVFLSYRRTDGSALAHQLRHALLDERWDVFLDRFSVPPATDFQHRLYRDLADKAFVLLLETPDVTGSDWVEHEVAFAHAHRLGLMSLALPETTPQRLYPSVLPQLRRQLTMAEVEPPTDSRTLTPAALASVLQEMDERHAEAYQQRRETLMLEARAEMRRHHYNVTPIGQWALLGSRGSEDEVVLTTARAPEPSDLHAAEQLRLEVRTRGRTARAWVVHPLEDINEERARLLGWLSRHRLVKPSPLMVLASRLAR